MKKRINKNRVILMAVAIVIVICVMALSAGMAIALTGDSATSAVYGNTTSSTSTTPTSTTPTSTTPTTPTLPTMTPTTPTECTLAITGVNIAPNHGVVGTPVTVSGTYTGTAPGGIFGWSLPGVRESSMGKLVTSGSAFSGGGTIPDDTVGVHTIHVTLIGSNCTFDTSVSFTVDVNTPAKIPTTPTPAPAPNPTAPKPAVSPPATATPMPNTGWEMIPFAFSGSGLLGAGSWLFRKSRR